MFQKEFDSYDKLIKYLSKCEHIDKASFDNNNGIWILNLVCFDKPEHLAIVQGVCLKCKEIIDPTRATTDKPTARIYCKKCYTEK